MHGGVSTGVAQALYEEFVYDEDGNPLTGTLVGYAFPSAADLPGWEAIEMETPTPANELGAKGIGESGTIGSTPGRAERGARRARPLRRPPRRHAVQRRERVARAAGGEGVTKVALTVNGERARGGRRAAAAARLLPARDARAEGHQRRLRHELLRSVHRAPRRRVRQVVHGARRAGGRQRGDDDRGPRRRTASCTRCSRPSTSSTRCSAATARRDSSWRRCRCCRRTRARRRTRSGSALEGNLCRCTGYHNIVRAVEAAARAGA